MQGPSNNKVLLFLFLIAIANILLLDIWFIINFRTLSEVKEPEEAASTQSTQNPLSENKSCPQSCLLAIDDATSLLKLTDSVAVTSTVQAGLTQKPGNYIRPTASWQSAGLVKEFFIPLGTGTSTGSDWTDVPGVKAEVDNSKYGKIQKVLFEASIHVPNANEIVEVRLYNESDKYIVGNSELSFPSGTSQNFRIAAISLGQGAKTYKVQMKTQLQYQAVLDQARIHITTY